MTEPSPTDLQGPGVLSICRLVRWCCPPDPLSATPASACGVGSRRWASSTTTLRILATASGQSWRRIRPIVLERVPDAEEGRSHGMPAFRYKRKPLLGFAARKDHLSLFPFSPHVVAAVTGRLAGYDLSKGMIRFPEAKPIPEDVIREILDLRLEEIG
jgi:uncharacterized protein YdhG (YjbR/CyaY superfamily)